MRTRAEVTQIPLRCRCGALRGIATDVSRDTGNRIVCYCDDCQAFAHFLDRSDVLDEGGGTDIFQLAPSQLRITEGADKVRCMRLSSKGLFRWYTDCCRTPIGNTGSARFPFVGVIHAFMDHASDGRARDDVLGKPRGFVQGRFAVGGLPAHARPTLTVAMVVHATRLFLGWWIKGKGTPSAFFDPQTRRPRAMPRVLTADERDALRRRAAPSPAQTPS
jgi:hypothetical protein